MEFKTSWKNQILSCAGVILVVALGTWVLATMKGTLLWGKNRSSIGLGLIAGCMLGLLAGTLYSLRSVFKAPKMVKIDEKGLHILKRNGEKVFLPWESVRRASLASRGGYRWIFITPTDQISLWDDGFSNTQWMALTWEIVEHLEKRNISYSGVGAK
ncbi:MAG: hypothetical protein DRI93_04360 [Aquificota bacterium]|nr:MAG: hypothetical protein DRI93_04360 [Aquificota bacterium]